MLKDLLTLLIRQPDFTIRLQPQGARLWQGQAPHGFVNDCTLIARDSKLTDGLIFGCNRSRGLVLEFKRIPEIHQQRFRNVWQIYRDS